MDGEWSLNAPAVARGVQRCLFARGYAPLTEFVLPDGARLDVAALGPTGDVLAVEIKVSVADLRADRKWPGYLGYCERFYFAIPPTLDPALVPGDQGLIVADRYGAEIVRESPVNSAITAPAAVLTLT